MTWWTFVAGVAAGIPAGLAVGFALGRRLPPQPARKVAIMRQTISRFMTRHVTSIVAVLVGMVLFGYLAVVYTDLQARSASDRATAASNRAAAASDRAAAASRRAADATARLTIYTHCVAGYLADLGTAQKPRAAASVAVTKAQHQIARDTRRFGADSPQAHADISDYLAKYRQYQQVVAVNPLPILPGCLTVEGGTTR